MTIADKLTLLANTKEALRAKLKLAKSVPFDKYPDYVNWNTVPSIPNKAFYADFTNDRYVKDGVPCSFEDLFTFSRAGKAWLVKDMELQEHAADVPRFDNGLLIEESATNFSVDISRYSIRTGATRTPNGQFTRFTKGEGDGLIYTYPPYPVFEDVIYHGWIKSPKTGGFGITSGIVGRTNYEYLEPESLEHLEHQFNSAREGRSHIGVRQDDLDPIDILHFQLESGTYASSPIVSESSSTTRPADYLINKFTGLTVTGDWDSTLNLSLVDGQLVHSGYGRIRSLEIN